MSNYQKYKKYKSLYRKLKLGGNPPDPEAEEKKQRFCDHWNELSNTDVPTIIQSFLDLEEGLFIIFIYITWILIIIFLCVVLS